MSISDCGAACGSVKYVCGTYHGRYDSTALLQHKDAISMIQLHACAQSAALLCPYYRYHCLVFERSNLLHLHMPCMIQMSVFAMLLGFDSDKIYTQSTMPLSKFLERTKRCAAI
jgi:hypothetical protein